MPTYINEREAWNFLMGPHNVKVRQEYWKMFREMFPDKQNSGLRDLTKSLRQKRNRDRIFKYRDAKDLQRIHPRAYRLLERFGTEYKPRLWGKPPTFGEPEPRRCSRNSYLLMSGYNSDRKLKFPLMYVEGVTIGSVVRPMLHAWNARGLESQTAIDWTFYAVSRWSVYLGIALTQEEHEKLARVIHPRKPIPALLLHKNNFPKLESELIKILKAR